MWVPRRGTRAPCFPPRAHAPVSDDGGSPSREELTLSQCSTARKADSRGSRGERPLPPGIPHYAAPGISPTHSFAAEIAIPQHGGCITPGDRRPPSRPARRQKRRMGRMCLSPLTAPIVRAPHDVACSGVPPSFAQSWAPVGVGFSRRDHRRLRRLSIADGPGGSRSGH
jgi:hypothetical protein